MRIYNKKLDNRGVTMVMSMVTIVVVSILASLILSLAFSNYKIKVTDYKSRQNFYSAEVAAGEIYSGIGTYAIDYLGSAYATTLSNAASADTSGSILKMSGSELNTAFKEEYMTNMINYMTGAGVIKDSLFVKDGSGSPSYASHPSYPVVLFDSDAVDNLVLTRLRNCVSGDPTITSITILKDAEPVKFDFNKFALVISDVHVTYLDGELQSNETFDVEITFPDWSLAYYTAGVLGNPYINYALIGNTGTLFNASASVTGGVYGGGVPKDATDEGTPETSYGIRINNVPVTLNPASGDIVTYGDIVIKSSVVNESSLTLTAGDLWCTNIVVESNNSTNKDKRSTLQFNTGTDLYVKDDLEIYGDNNYTNISGNYYGYGMNITDGKAATSSAIIINGDAANLNVSSTSKLYLGGTAYINMDPTKVPQVNYVTGESVALKGNQVAYLVPSSWMSGLSNPCVSSAYNPATPASSYVSTAKLALLSGLLDPATPIVSKYARSKYYFYFNFKDADSAATFIDNAAAGGYGGVFLALINANAAAMEISSTDPSYVQPYSVNVATGNVTSMGAISNVSGGSVNVNVNYSSSALTSTDYKNYDNRYKLMKSLLQKVYDETDIVLNPRNANGQEYPLENINSTPFDNYIDIDKLRSAPYNSMDSEANGITVEAVNVEIGGVPTTVSCRLIYSTGDVEINTGTSKDCTIVVAEGDVVVNTGFDGMVFAKGAVRINGNAFINATPEYVDAILDKATYDGYRVGEVFRYYQTADDDAMEEIDTVQYSDVIEFANWRKY